MSLFPSLSDLISDNPIHKAIGSLQAGIKTARSDIQALSSSLKMDPASATTKSTSTQVYPTPQPATVAQPKPQSEALELPSEEDTAIELKHRLLEQVADAEDDLEHKMKIRAKDGRELCCSCLDGKHNVKIKAKCLELAPKDPSNPIYQDIINWFDTNQSKMTANACRTGNYEEEYIKMANEMGSFRRRLQKQLMGTQYSGDAVKSAKDFLKEKGD
jgi:hypothetical protein